MMITYGQTPVTERQLLEKIVSKLEAIELRLQVLESVSHKQVTYEDLQKRVDEIDSYKKILPQQYPANLETLPGQPIPSWITLPGQLPNQQQNPQWINLPGTLPSQTWCGIGPAPIPFGPALCSANNNQSVFASITGTPTGSAIGAEQTFIC